MQTSKIHILEKFGVSSVVMPYFGYSHQSFLLLTRLSGRSRAMLVEFYQEMISWLYDWNMMISITDHNIKMLYLPSNLFKYSINLDNKLIVQQFVEFLSMINQHKGHYFNSHYMHDRLCILNLYILPNLIQELVPNFDILKSIKIVNKKDWTSPVFEYNHCRIIDKFLFRDYDFIVDDLHFVLPQYVIDASKIAESESYIKPFYKIFTLFLTYKSYSKAISILEDIGNIGMQINFVHTQEIERKKMLTN